MLISNTIYDAKRSFNRTSTASRLMFVRPPPIHHHYLRPPHPVGLSTTTNHPNMCPSPLLRDVGTTNIASSHLRSEDKASVAPPLSKGMWVANSHSTKEFGEAETRGGTQELVGPCSASQKRTTIFIVVRFPLSSVFNPADSLCYPTPQQQAATPTRKTARNEDNANPGASHH